MLVEQPGERGGDFPDIAVEVLTLVDPICWAESTLPNQPARSIDVFAITDMQDQDDQPSVFNLVDYPEVPNLLQPQVRFQVIPRDSAVRLDIGQC